MYVTFPRPRYQTKIPDQDTRPRYQTKTPGGFLAVLTLLVTSGIFSFCFFFFRDCLVVFVVRCRCKRNSFSTSAVVPIAPLRSFPVTSMELTIYIL